MGKTFKALIFLLFVCVNICFAQGYVVTKSGKVAILLSAPHGGKLKPANIPNRDCQGCKVDEDSYTKEIMLGVNKELEGLFKSSVYYVYTNLHRSKIDFNREVIEATDSNKTLVPVYNSYHNFIKSFSMKYDKALVIDFHGQTHEEDILEVGGNDERQKYIFGSLFRANYGHMTVYPSPGIGKPLLYFSGGYITKTIYSKETHFQLELSKSMRFKSRERVSKAIAKTIYTYYNLMFK